jgi:hypothetical protein
MLSRDLPKTPLIQVKSGIAVVLNVFWLILGHVRSVWNNGGLLSGPWDPTGSPP